MLEKGIALEKKITGKAVNENELILQVSALNSIRNTCEPTLDEVSEILDKVKEAATDLTTHIRENRTTELLSMERTDMWNSFFSNPLVDTVTIYLDKKNDRYAYRVNKLKSRISYAELNEAYTIAEIARREQAGELVDEVITVARDNKFNNYASPFFAEAYKALVDHTLGKSACGSKSYVTVDKKGNEVSVKVCSIKQLVADLDELVHYLLPEGFLNANGKELHMLKKDVHNIGFALNKYKLGKGHESNRDTFAMEVLMDTIANRIDNVDVKVTVSTATLDSVRTPTADEPENTDKVGGITKMNKN